MVIQVVEQLFPLAIIINSRLIYLQQTAAVANGIFITALLNQEALMNLKLNGATVPMLITGAAVRLPLKIQ